MRRGGAHVARVNKEELHVNLPNELALRFEEPIAVVWSKHILTSLRKRTAALGGDYVALVAEVTVSEATEIPAPKLAAVVPCAQCVNWPVIVTD